jgi:multimeric flavodoxin WrbA
MKIIAINGSPRKKWNTATLLENCLNGAASAGAETELVHLYDLSFKGCISCFSCKKRDGKSYGRCAVKDDLTPIFERVEAADGLILGSPIYLGTVTGEMRSFFERLIFQYLTYTEPLRSLFPGKIRTGIIYTMNVSEADMKQRGYDRHLELNEMYLRTIFGDCRSIFSFDTYQFDDYTKVVADRFDPNKKAKRREEIFPVDCEKAYRMGAWTSTSPFPRMPKG